MYLNIGVIALFALAYSLVATRLERSAFNGALAFLVFGVVAGPVVLGFLNLSLEGEDIRLLAELTLALVLFLDASSTNLGVLRRSIQLPQRLLLVGLPLTILLGIGFGVLLFPNLSFFEVAILATMLAPTDAALGKAVVTNPAVPAPAREGLNLESGLNDGICVPILFTFLALAAGNGAEGGGWLALKLVGEEIGIGAGIGLALAIPGALAVRNVQTRGWLKAPWTGMPTVALAFASFSLAQAAGGSGFIAAFVGGLAFGWLAREHKHALIEDSEGTSEAFSLITWVAFGAAVVFQHSGTVDWRAVVYALLSLTVIRMLPVFVSLSGLGMRADAKLFIGWFGPRGLASIVFGVIVLGEQLPGGSTLTGTVVATVVLSVVAHGLTANPLAARFGARRATSSEASP